MAKRIYLAGGLFNDCERMYNVHVKNIFAEHGIEIVLPQEQECKVLDNADMGNPVEAKDVAHTVCMLDIATLMSCDALVINVDGATADCGACVELGIAWSVGKPVYAIKTDTRKAEFGLDANMMIVGLVRAVLPPVELAELIEKGDLEKALEEMENRA